MNLVIIKGNVAGKEDKRSSNEGLSIQRIRVAVKRRRRAGKEDVTDFFSCTAFGKTADALNEWINVGDPILIEGTLQNDNYEKDGVKHYRDQISINNWEFCGRKGDGSSSGSSSGSGSASTSSAASTASDVDAEGFMNIPDGLDEELPFT